MAPATLLESTKLSVGPDSSFHQTRRVVLPTHCCHVEPRRSGDLRKFAYEFWMLTQYTDQNSCLVIGLLAVLFPVLEGRWLGVNGLGKYPLGHLQLFAQGDDFRACSGFDWSVFDLVGTQGALAFTCCGQVVEAFDQLGKNIAFGHGVFLAFNSRSRSIFSCLRWQLLRPPLSVMTAPASGLAKSLF